MARPAVKKTQIIDAAIELFATKGLARTTVRDIAENAGVAEGALYRHWPGKNEMAWELYCHEVKAFASLLKPALVGSDGPFDGRLTEAVRFLYRFYQEQPTRFSFILLTQHGFPNEQLLDPENDPFCVVVEFLQREMRQGQIPPGDPEILAALVMGAVMRPLIMHRYGRFSSEPVDMADLVATRLAAMLGFAREMI